MAREHIWEKHENCILPYCSICEDGIAVCSVCSGLEGALTSECPGERISSACKDEIHSGKIDFRDGRWQEGIISPHSPAPYWKAKHIELGYEAPPTTEV